MMVLILGSAVGWCSERGMSVRLLVKHEYACFDDDMWGRWWDLGYEGGQCLNGIGVWNLGLSISRLLPVGG